MADPKEQRSPVADCRWCGDTRTVPGPAVPCPRCSPETADAAKAADRAVLLAVVAEGLRRYERNDLTDDHNIVDVIRERLGVAPGEKWPDA